MSSIENIKTGFWGMVIIILFILGGIILYFAGKLAYKEIFKRNIRIEYFQDRLSAEGKRMNAVIVSAQKTPQDLAYILEFHETDDSETNILLKSVLFNNEELYGCCIAYEPYQHKKDSLYDAPYVYRSADTLVFTNLNDPNYNYLYKDWYLIPKTLMKPTWSEPYYDEGGGNLLMSTYSVPLFKFDGSKDLFYGIVTVDVSIEWLTNAVQSIGRVLNGYAILISENGTILSAPNKDLIFHETIFTLAAEKNLPVLREIGRDLQQGKSGNRAIEKKMMKNYWHAFYSPIPANKWGLIILIPDHELSKI
ncbi:MAG: hypothetical protein PHS30_06650 [Bacteroidales bacterium]|nr:hypothetical protein [Bacteroidales bacterium]